MTKNIFKVTTEDDLTEILKDNKDKLVTVMFSAKWHESSKPSKSMKQDFIQLSKRREFEKVFFIYIDIDNYEDDIRELKKSIVRLPTFIFFFSQDEVSRFDGSNVQKLCNTIVQLESMILSKKEVLPTPSRVPVQISPPIVMQSQPPVMQFPPGNLLQQIASQLMKNFESPPQQTTQFYSPNVPPPMSIPMMPVQQSYPQLAFPPNFNPFAMFGQQMAYPPQPVRQKEESESEEESEEGTDVPSEEDLTLKATEKKPVPVQST